MKIVVVGCGLSGIVSSIVLKNLGHKVEILDSRNHIGGNCHDSNLNGVIVHNYGPHIFHTNDEHVWKFVNRYTTFNEFKYKPKALLNNHQIISLPYSLTTIKELGRNLSSQEIIDLIYKDYSEKQWGMPFDKISNAILNRVPVLKNEESPSWFGSEKYQGIPSNGYTHMMNNMLDGIKIHLNADKKDFKKIKADLIVYTGRIDEYFNFEYGELPYRTLKFEHEITSNRLFHHAINQCNKINSYTRIYDHSYFLNQNEPLTVITKEYPSQFDGNGIPYYPIPFGTGYELYKKYKKLADNEKNVIFMGRLATYKYLDMWVAIKQAMNIHSFL
jgi:UDP-galactopyranose mutase